MGTLLANLAAKVEKLIETAKYYLKKFSTQALSHIIPSLGTNSSHGGNCDFSPVKVAAES